MELSRHVVVGAGLAGAATALALARRGLEVTLVERTHPAAHDGSSHGSARIFRYAYPDRFYADLVVRARTGFDELERESGRTLIDSVGALDFGEQRHPRHLARVLEAAGVEHELVSAARARERWPAIAFDTEVLWQPGAGVLDAEATVGTEVELMQRHGGRLVEGWELASVERTATGYRLRSTDGRLIDAGAVVVAAGGWLPALLDDLALPPEVLRLVPPLVVRQEQAFHFPYREAPVTGGDTELVRAPVMPTLIHKSDDIQTYSLPGGRDAGGRGQKLAEFAAGKVIGSARDQDGLVDPANRRRVVAYAEQYLPGLVPEPYAETTCLFTSTPTEDFVLDRIEGLTLLSPCSGHGAKFSPLLGELAADVATGRSGPDRFTLAAHSSTAAVV